MVPFEFATETQILFGRGKLAELPRLVRPFGPSALLVTGRNGQRAHRLVQGLEDCGISCQRFEIASEPTVELVRSGARAAKNCTQVIGFGGGSAIDAAKAIAVLATNSGEPLDYLEVVGRGLKLEKEALPFTAVPTTAGTGAEVTHNAVIDSPEHGVKASLRSKLMRAKIALVDPELTFDLPQALTASTGMDALTQLVEAYVSSAANPFTDLFCVEGLKNARSALPAAFHDGCDAEARERMSWASLLSGLALANAGLGAVHGFAGVLGGLLHAPHGELCAAMLPAVMSANIHALRERAPESVALSRYRHLAVLLTDNEEAQPENGIRWVADLCASLGTKPLGAHGLQLDQIPSLVVKATASSSMKKNPIPLTTSELAATAQAAL